MPTNHRQLVPHNLMDHLNLYLLASQAIETHFKNFYIDLSIKGHIRSMKHLLTSTHLGNQQQYMKHVKDILVTAKQ